MKKLKLSKIIASSLVIASVLALNPIDASAEWKQDSNGWWNTEGSSWSVGWRLIDGKWYYFGQDGYMEHDTIIDGYEIGSDGAWIESTKNSDNSTTAQGEYDSEGITMKTEKSVYELGTKEIKLYITNNTNQEYDYGLLYSVEKFENNEWNTLILDTDFDATAIILNPKETVDVVAKLSTLQDFKNLTPGKYRIVKDDLTAEFELKQKYLLLLMN